MKKRQVRLVHTHSTSTPYRWSSLMPLLLTLCLILGSSLLKGCAVGAALGLMGATTNAGSLVSSAVEPDPKDNEPGAVFAFLKDDAPVYAGPGEEYSQIATLKEGTEIQVLGQQGDWIECRCAQFKVGWVNHSVVMHE